jgi:hypothetical protein
MDSTARQRSAQWRARRRLGAVSIKLDVLPKHRRALEAIGLITPGYRDNMEAVAWAVERYLDTAPAMQAMGEALYPDWPDDDEEGQDETPSQHNSGKNEE